MKMNSIVEAMLKRYNPKNNEERENAAKEIIQEIALAGLSRGGFFKKSCFLWWDESQNLLWIGSIQRGYGFRFAHLRQQTA